MNTTEAVEVAVLEMPSLTQLAQEIDNHWQLFQQAARTTLDEALEIGVRLQQAKEQVKWGQWQNWVEENFEFGIRREQQFRKLAEWQDHLLPKCEADSHFTITDALEEVQNQEGLKRLKGDVPKQIENACEVGHITHDDAVALKLELTNHIQALEAGEIRATEAETHIRKGLKRAVVAQRTQTDPEVVEISCKVDEADAESVKVKVIPLKAEADSPNPDAFLSCVQRLLDMCTAAAKLDVPTLTTEQIKKLSTELLGATTNIHKLRRRLDPNG